MALKLIKKDDRFAAQAKALNFSDHAEVAAAQAAELPWLQAPGAVRGLGGGKPPAHDPLHIEKMAYENGFRQGEKAGMEIAEKKIDALMQRYAEAIAEVARLRSSLYTRSERDVVRLALEVARKIVHREIQADREIIQTLVKVALGHVAGKSAVTIRLHPADYAYILEHRAELKQQSDEDRELVLVADKTIERGGCLIQTECGDVDARIEEEFREVERSFFDNQSL